MAITIITKIFFKILKDLEEKKGKIFEFSESQTSINEIEQVETNSILSSNESSLNESAITLPRFKKNKLKVFRQTLSLNSFNYKKSKKKSENDGHKLSGISRLLEFFRSFSLKRKTLEKTKDKELEEDNEIEQDDENNTNFFDEPQEINVDYHDDYKFSDHGELIATNTVSNS
jgi:hypothetical protein